MADFKVGDVVRLKSGGPLMTIRVIDNDGTREIYCDWFDSKDELKGTRFIDETLALQ